MASLLEQIVDEQNLKRAFLKARRTVWSPRGNMGRQFLQIWNNWEAEFDQLVNELRSGTFRVTGTQAVIIRRSTGAKPRGVYRSCVRDRWVQQAVYEVLKKPVGDAVATPVSYGRRKADGEGSRAIRVLAENIQFIQASRSHWVYETDIKDFFPSIDRKKLLPILSGVLADDSAVWLLEQLIDTTVSDYVGEASDPNLRHFWNADTGVPQGNVLSPLLANLYLKGFDEWAYAQDWTMFRYVDDLIVFCEDAATANKAAQDISQQLRLLDLKIHELQEESKKSAIRRPGTSVTFVGICFTGDRMKPTSKAVDRLIQRIQQHCFDAESGAPNLYDLLTRVNNLLRGWHAAYAFCDTTRAFRREIDKKVARLVGIYAKEGNLVARDAALQSVDAARWFGLVQLADLDNNFSYPDDRPIPGDDELGHFGLINGEDVLTAKPS